MKRSPRLSKEEAQFICYVWLGLGSFKPDNPDDQEALEAAIDKLLRIAEKKSSWKKLNTSS